jgi:hypothetical protein
VHTGLAAWAAAFCNNKHIHGLVATDLRQTTHRFHSTQHMQRYYISHQLTHKGQNIPVLHEGVQWINAYCYSTCKKKDETFLATC